MICNISLIDWNIWIGRINHRIWIEGNEIIRFINSVHFSLIPAGIYGRNRQFSRKLRPWWGISGWFLIGGYYIVGATPAHLLWKFQYSRGDVWPLYSSAWRIIHHRKSLGLPFFQRVWRHEQPNLPPLFVLFSLSFFFSLVVSFGFLRLGHLETKER